MFIAVIPAYNEEDNIQAAVRDAREYVDKVVVVDDGSLDQTAKKAREEKVVVLEHIVNRGQGAAIETGRQYAVSIDADFMVIFDGDGQFDGKDIKTAFAKIKESKVDVLLGSRFINNKNVSIPWSKKKVLLPISRLLDRFFTGVHLSDVHNGFKIFNRKAIEKIEINQDRMAHATEIPMLVKKHNLEYIEHPVTVSYSEYGQNAMAGFKILKDLFFGKFIK